MPSFSDISQFLTKIFDSCEIPAECGVTAVTYVDRLFHSTGVRFNINNWRPIVFTAIHLASKVWEDVNVWNADYIDSFPELEIKTINQLEREFLKMIGFNLDISASVYAEYYFKLRSLAEISDKTFPRHPLDHNFIAMFTERSGDATEKARQAFLHDSKCISASGCNKPLEIFRAKRLGL